MSNFTPSANGQARLPAPLILGIETSCDETAAAVLGRDAEDRVQVRSSVVASQVEHEAFGGVVPEIAARAHVRLLEGIVRQALEQAKVSINDIGAVAATAGPGLVGGVMVGLSFAKGLALGKGLPLIAVNHLEGHALSARLEDEVAYPFLLLLVSGGHCQLLEVRGVGDMTRLGSTIDDAAGEAFDKTAKALGLGYPGGPALERLAKNGDADRFDLPCALRGRAGFDFSFSGLKTAAARQVETCQSEQDRADLAASTQAAIAQQLTERTEAAMGDFAERHGGDLRFVVAGGVAANGLIRQQLEAAAKRQGFSFTAPPLAYCTDNAAMIALAGLERFERGLTSNLDAVARPRWPLDEAAAMNDPTHKAGRKGAKA